MKRMKMVMMITRSDGGAERGLYFFVLGLCSYCLVQENDLSGWPCFDGTAPICMYDSIFNKQEVCFTTLNRVSLHLLGELSPHFALCINF